MTVDLTSVLARIGQAHEHTKTVKNEIRAWRDSNPYVITREVNAEFTRYSLVAHIGIEPPLQRWSLLVADAIHNLRSALDHLVYAIAMYEAGGQNPPPNEGKLAFPIGDTDPKFKEVAGRIKTLSEPVRTAIERCQPYNRPHPTLPPLLQIINSVENTNKHRLLRVAFAAMITGNISVSGRFTAVSNAILTLNFGEIKNGTEVAAYTFDRATPDVKFDRFDFLLGASIWHGKRDDSGPDGSDRSEVPALMSLLTKEVREVMDIVIRAALNL